MKKTSLYEDSCQATCDIITAIIESNLTESNALMQTEGNKVSRMLSTKKKSGIHLSLEGRTVYLKINVGIRSGTDIIQETGHFQKQIKEEITHLTGLKVKKIDVRIDRIILTDIQ